jgi:23S rRNA A2030 N6-methylase RlmJ
MWDTGIGQGDEQIRKAINRLVARLDTEKDPQALTNLVTQIRRKGLVGRINGSPEVVAAVERAESRLQQRGL